MLRIVIAVLVLSVSATLVAGLAGAGAGQVLMQLLPVSAAGAARAYAVLIAAGAGVIAGLAIGLLRPWDETEQEGVQDAPLPPLFILFGATWLLFVVPIAAYTGRLALLPMTLSLLAAGAAFAAARRTKQLLENGDRLELRHDIVGIGGGLGGWKLTHAAAAALLTALLSAGAVGLAMTGLHSNETAAAAGAPASGKAGGAGAKGAATSAERPETEGPR